MSSLTEKQKVFADYYITSLNAYQSAIKAGYSENYAKGNISKLLENERVKEYIDERLNQANKKRILTIEQIMEFHSNVVENKYEELGYTKPLYLKDRQVSAQELTKRLELLEGSNKDKGMTIKIVKASEKHGE